MDTLGALTGPIFAFYCASVLFLSTKTIFVISFIPGIFAVFTILFFTKDIKIARKQIRIPSTFWHDIGLLPRSYIIFLIILFIFDLANLNKLLLLARAREILMIDPSLLNGMIVLLYAIFNLTRASAEFGVGVLSDYINRYLLFAIFGMGFLSIAAWLLLSPHATFFYCIGVFILAGISVATVTTLKKTCAAHMLPAEIRGLGFGFMQASEGFALLFSNMFIGFIWSYYSAFLSFSYVITLSLSAMIALLIFSAIRN